MRKPPIAGIALLLAAAVWPLADSIAAGTRDDITAGAIVPGATIRIPDTGLTPSRQILHLLNRAAYGPRPGDVERVGAEGLAAWLERQLQPSGIPDPGLQERLAGLDTLGLSTRDLLVDFPPPQLLRGLQRQLDSRMGMDPDASQRLFPEQEEEDRRREAQERGGRPASSMSMREGGATNPLAAMAAQSEGPSRIVLDLAQARVVRAVYSERQLLEVMTDFWFNHFNVYSGKANLRWIVPSYEYDAIRPHALGRFRDLLGATARHPAMLAYLDNWVSAASGFEMPRNELRYRYVQALQKQGIEPYDVALSVLRDRGLDTSGMEERIDRAISMGFRVRRQTLPDSLGPRRHGLNENYARELLELHTLGVDGGYTQQDIVEVARCFTGWTLTPMQHDQAFLWVGALHDRGKKVVLGQAIQGKGMAEGDAVLDLLSRHPSTARFVSWKLARQFVRDEPSAALVERMARTFLATDGEIKPVLRTLFSSEEFWSPDALRAKVKTPLEFVASAARASGAELAPPAGMEGGAKPGLVFALHRLGQPLYGAQPPTGYDATAEAWVSTGALLARMKLAVGLAAGQIPGVRIEPTRDLPAAASTRELIEELSLRLLGQAPPAPSLDALAAQVERERVPGTERPLPRKATERLAMGWILASPEFQRR